jgi:hypothetical protein
MSSPKSFCHKINVHQILIGLLGLLIGTLVYLVDRPPDQTYFVFATPFNISLFKTLPNLFGHIGNSLPSFIHVFSFILLTAGIIPCRKKGFLNVCMFWFSIDCVFELGQKFSSFTLEIIPSWFSSVPFLENTRNYFFYGTFDFDDLFAILIGTVIAYFVLLFTIKDERGI